MYDFKARFTFKLWLTLILFSIIISFTVATTDHFRLRDEIIRNSQMQVQMAVDMTEQSLQKIEKAYYLFGKDQVRKMEESSQYLVNLYQKNPDFNQWDFQKLKNSLGFDIYIINDHNVIIHSTLQDDLGLDFKVCCNKFSSVLDERRKSGRFHHDGIDMEQSTGNIKKYSYMGTPDQRYLIELSFSLENGAIFREFNFFTAIDEIKQKYPLIYEINVLNKGGISLGQSIETGMLTGQRFSVFKQTLDTQQANEFHDAWKSKPAAYRYISYVSQYDNGSTKYKVLEIIYNTKDLELLLQENTNSFYLRLFLVFMITIATSLVISRWVAKPMYLAFHDSLTGLKNRAAFEEILPPLLAKNKGTIAMLLFDLDNFKSVNDLHGHDKGDWMLIKVSQS
ncbi:MAG: GGDEF domain-containing protein, partial [Clostridia bacterium]